MQMLVSKLAESALDPYIVDPIRRWASIYNAYTESTMEHWHYPSTTEDTTPWPNASEGHFHWTNNRYDSLSGSANGSMNNLQLWSINFSTYKTHPLPHL